MEFHMKLPRNQKEFIVFLGVISLISVNIIAPLITCFELGFNLNSWRLALHIIPAIWISVVILVFVTHKPARFLTSRVIAEDDSFGAQMFANIACTVLLMSVCLTVIGTWIGNGSITLEPIRHFFYKWPRNFSISLFVELLIAQPVARTVMVKIHACGQA